MRHLFSLLRFFVASALVLCLAAPAAAQSQTFQADSAEVVRLHRRVDPYLSRVAAQPDWLVSRLQMNWQTHAAQSYVRGEQFDHVGKERADVPTVKQNGSRSTASDYHRPALDDILPYDDDSLGRVTFYNNVSGQREPVSPARTGCNIAPLNRQVLALARDAAKLYLLTGDTAYRQLAQPVVLTFLRGIGATRVPIDLNHGHQQTLMGLTTFEVIHEDAVNEATEAYRLLGLREADCDDALRHWADVIIQNGVPHNNWNLFQADFILKIAEALADDSLYADRRGRQHYVRAAVEGEGLRQWGIRRLADFGYGPQGNVWYESPGYASGMVRDLVAFANRVDRDYGIDLLSQVPQLKQGVWALPQYLMPNRMMVGFGDTHPNYLSSGAADALADYARRHQLTALADSAESLARALRPDASEADVMRWATPSFYAPNVSWYVLRDGMDPRHGLMASLNGSLGNHQHANGISLELYGRGYVLAPDAGIGKTLYSGQDYAEYYSQMPAHNTVVVDGVSSYPVMMSHHAFSVRHEGQTSSDGATAAGRYVTVDFVEPETQSDQRRTVAVVRTSTTGGYYVDVFRSRRRDGRDRFHDYFYHNLGQEMALSPDSLSDTDELAFAGGHLYAYSYLYDQRKLTTASDAQVRFTTHAADGRDIIMRLWMQGQPDRDLFTALAPPNMEYERMPGQPYDIDEQPTLTYVARQRGEAWTRPFVAVLSPSDSTEPSDVVAVSFFQPKGSRRSHAVGIRVTLRDGRQHRIVVSEDGEVSLSEE